MLIRLFVIVAFFLSLGLFAVQVPAYAAAEGWGNCVANEDGAQIATLNCIPVVFNNVIYAALLFVGSVAVILLIYAGIRFVMSGGDPKQTQQARQIIIYAILGLVVVLTSFGIIYLIGYLTNSTNCITNINSMTTGGCQ
jgi:Type IV secretion system pilin